MRAHAERARAAAADGGVGTLLGLHSAGCECGDAANGAVVNVASDDGADSASGGDANPEGEDASAALVQQQEATATAAVAFLRAKPRRMALDAGGRLQIELAETVATAAVFGIDLRVPPKVLNASSPPPIVLSDGIWPSSCGRRMAVQIGRGCR